LVLHHWQEGAMPIYLKYDGINGDVNESKHKDWIEVLSCSLNVSRQITMPVGGGRTRDAQLPHVSEVMCTKTHDRSSVELFRTSLGGGSGKLVKIDFVAVGGAQQSNTYLQWELENCMISSYSVSSGGDKPVESFSLNFTKVLEKFIPSDETGKQGSPVSAGWDLLQQKQV
jgi:type VI secretion system secreted protein Hcp